MLRSSWSWEQVDAYNAMMRDGICYIHYYHICGHWASTCEAIVSDGFCTRCDPVLRHGEH